MVLTSASFLLLNSTLLVNMIPFGSGEKEEFELNFIH